MRPPSCLRGLFPAVLLLAVLAPRAAAQPDYNRADMIRVAPSRLYGVPPWVAGFGFGGPTWLDDSTRFHYRVMTPRGAEFILEIGRAHV